MSVAALVVGFGIGAAGDGSGGEPGAAPAPTVTVTEEAPAQTQAADNAASETEEPKQPETWGDGVYKVGKEEMPAGRYKTTVPDTSLNCYWQRAKDDSGDFDSIIANNNYSPGASASVTVSKGEFFETQGCGSWERAE